jgi:DNA-directed RNA polymerase subunit RPC12/RpoP
LFLKTNHAYTRSKTNERMTMGRPPKKMNHLGEYRCSRCTKWKPPSEFHANKRMSNGLHSQCKDCFNARRVVYDRKQDVADYLRIVEAMHPTASDETQLETAELLADQKRCEDSERWADLEERIQIMYEYMRTGLRRKTAAEREAEEEATHQQMQAFIKAGGFTALAQRDAQRDADGEIPRENPLTPQRDPETPVVRPDPPTRPAPSLWDDGSDEEDEGRDGPYRFVPIGPPA